MAAGNGTEKGVFAQVHFCAAKLGGWDCGQQKAGYGLKVNRTAIVKGIRETPQVA